MIVTRTAIVTAIAAAAGVMTVIMIDADVDTEAAERNGPLRSTTAHRKNTVADDDDDRLHPLLLLDQTVMMVERTIVLLPKCLPLLQHNNIYNRRMTT
jgi:CMP-N-acetylneuraminic acid synthetase